MSPEFALTIVRATTNAGGSPYPYGAIPTSATDAPIMQLYHLFNIATMTGKYNCIFIVIILTMGLLRSAKRDASVH
jgi:hypothetical protein